MNPDRITHLFDDAFPDQPVLSDRQILDDIERRMVERAAEERARFWKKVATGVVLAMAAVVVLAITLAVAYSLGSQNRTFEAPPDLPLEGGEE